MNTTADEFELAQDLSVLTSSRNIGDALRDARPSRRAGLLEGCTLAGGRVLVGRNIGSGAMGTVYEAVCDGHHMAIKVLNQLQSAQVYRLKTEFRRLSQLHHPNVISVYELFCHDEEWFFTMDRVQGLPLHRHIEARFFSGLEDDYEAMLRCLFGQLFAGIAAIHGASLVHRDIKPANILVTAHGHLVIVDFGLVSEQHAGGVGQTIDDRISGTLGYIAPEVLAGGPATPASDCYALGATLRLMLNMKLPTGTAIGDASNVTSSVTSQAQATSVWPPQDLFILCERLLSVQPYARPNISELLTASSSWSTVPRQCTSQPCPANDLFVGREKELSVIREAYELARGGAPSIALVRGSSGCGKSALLGKFVAGLRAQGVIVLEGRCSEWESVPYKGLDEVIDNFSRLVLKMPHEQAAHLVPRHASEVVRVFPALLRIESFAEAAESGATETAEPWLLRSRAVAGMKDTLYRLAERHRVAIAIDDLQWVDADTIQMLADLLSPPAPPNLFLIASATEGASTKDLLHELSRAAEVTSLSLEPLNTEEGRLLALAVLQDGQAKDAELVERIVRESRGIPLFITEFARDFADMPDTVQPGILSQVLLARIERLSVAAKRLLELIAIAFRPLTIQVAVSCGIEDVQSSLRQLMAHRLVCSQALAEQQIGFRPYTDYVRQVVIRALTNEQTTALHTGLAQALEWVPNSEPEWLLAHYRGAGRHDQAKRYAVVVAKRALGVLAFDHAASLFAVALDLTTPDAPGWSELNVSCADALSKAGRGAEAAQVYARAASKAPRERRSTLLNMAATHWIRSGHIEKGVEAMRSTLEDAGISWPKTAGEAILRLLSQRTVIRMHRLSCNLRPEHEVPKDLLAKLDALNPAQTALGTFDYVRGATFAAAALPLALKAREPKRLLAALGTEAIYSTMLNGLAGEQRATKIKRQIDIIREHDTGPYEQAATYLVRALCAYWSGHWKDVPSLAAQAETILRRKVAGAVWELSLLRSIRHTVLLSAGRQGDLSSELPNELARASAQDDRYAHFDLLRRSVSLHLAKDNVADAHAALVQLEAQRRQYPFLALDHLIMSSVVATYLYSGDATAARRELRRRWRLCCEAGMNRLPLVRLTVLGMEFDCIGSDKTLNMNERARRAERLARLAGKEKIAWAPALSSTLLGFACESRGEFADAASHYRNSAAIFAIEGLAMASTAAKSRLVRILQMGAANPLAEFDCTNALIAPETPESILRASGIVQPDRWLGIVHSLF